MVSPILLIAVPLGLAFAIPLLELAWRRAVRYVPVAAMLFNLTASLMLLPTAVRGAIIVRTAGWAPPFSIHLVAGPLGLLLSTLIAVIGLLVAVYGIDYIREIPHSLHTYSRRGDGRRADGGYIQSVRFL